jgi:YggT family protein
MLMRVPFAAKLGIHWPSRALCAKPREQGDRRMGNFLYFIVDSLISLVILALVLSAILSWLIAFDVVNMRNRFIYQFSRFLDAVTRPILKPVQRIIPPFGGVDITPVVVIIVLIGIRRFLLPLIFGPIIGVLG